MHDTLFKLLLPFSILLLFLFLLLFPTFSDTSVHCTCVQCTVGSLNSFSVFLLFLLLFRTRNFCNFLCWSLSFLLLLLVLLLFLLFGTFCFNIVNLDSFHVWFLFFILLSLPLQCDVGSRLVLEHLALRLVLVELGALLGSGRDLGNLSTFELSDARFHLSTVLDSKVSVSLLSQGVHPASQGGLRGEHSRHFALELRARLSNKLCVVYQAVLGGVVLSLQRLKQSLLSAQYLHCRGGMLGEVHQGAGVGDQPGADQLAHQHGQVGCDRHHAVLQVLVQLPSVFLDLDNLLAKMLDVDYVFSTNLCAHTDLRSLLHLLFHLFRQHVAQINRLGVVPGPHQLHSAHEGEVVCDDLSQLGEVPAVPFSAAHDIVVQFLVQVVKKRYSLHNHSVNFVGAKFQLVTRQRMGQTKLHGCHFFVW